MLKYMLAIFAVAGITLVAGFFILATLNDDKAAAGPAPLFTVTVTDDGASPGSLAIERDRLFELKLVNNGRVRRVVNVNTDDVEHLPVETDFFDNHAQVVPKPGIDLGAASGQAYSVLVRFTKRGTYELALDSPGRPEARIVITVEVS